MRKQKVADHSDRMVLVMITSIMILFVASASYVFYRDKNLLSSKKQIATVETTNTPIKINSNKKYKDSDKDGLADWEEELWNTDPNNPDTDGDGTNDGDEVKENNDPNISGSGKLAFEVNSNLEILPPTETEIASKEIFNSFITTLQNKEPFSTEKRKEIAKDTLDIVFDTQNKPTYTKEDVRIVPATFASRKYYMKTIVNELHKMINGNITNEYESLFELAQGDKKEATQNLIKTSEFYKKHSLVLKNISVPSDAVAIHIEMVQSLLNYIYVLDSLGNMFNDPLRSADAMSSFKNTGNKLNKSFRKLRLYIDTFAKTTKNNQSS